MAVYLFGLLALLLSISAPAQGGPSCFKCDLQVHPAACMEIIKCGDHEYCYTEKVLNNLGVAQFTSGCKPRADCVKTVRRRAAVTACSECCNSTACNAKLCGASPDPTVGNRLWCANCANQQLPDHCDHVTVCSQDQHCSVSEHSVFGMTTYSMECTLVGTCQGKTLANDKFQCCDSHLCNTNMALVSPDIYTQPPPTTTTPPPSAATAHINESAVSYLSHNQPSEKLQIFCEVGGFPVPNVTWYFIPDVTSSGPASTAPPGNSTSTASGNSTAASGTTSVPSTTAATCTCPTTSNVTATTNTTTTPGASTTAASNTTAATTAVPPGQPITSGIITSNGLSTLEIASPNASVAGQYVCRAVNPMGTVDSNTTVSFSALPRIDGKANESVSANVRDEVLLNCDVSGVPTPTVEWTLPPNAGGVEKLANGSLLIHNAHGDNTGDYRCTANNTAGTADKNFTLTVTDPSTPTCPTPAAITVAATTPPPTTTSPQTCPPPVTCPPTVTCPPAPACPTMNCPLPVTCPPPVTCPTVLTSLLTSPTPCPTQAALVTTTPSTTPGQVKVNLTATGALWRNAEAGPHHLHCDANSSSPAPVMWERLEHDFDHSNAQHVYIEEPSHGILVITKQPSTQPINLTGVYKCFTLIPGSGSAFYVLYKDIPSPLDCRDTFDGMGQVPPGTVLRSYCGPCPLGSVQQTHIAWTDVICSSAINFNVITDTGGEITWLFRKNNEVSFLVNDHSGNITFIP